MNEIKIKIEPYKFSFDEYKKVYSFDKDVYRALVKLLKKDDKFKEYIKMLKDRKDIKELIEDFIVRTKSFCPFINLENLNFYINFYTFIFFDKKFKNVIFRIPVGMLKITIGKKLYSMISLNNIQFETKIKLDENMRKRILLDVISNEK